MADYESLVQDIRDCAESKKLCKECPFSKFGTGSRCKEAMARDAADAIEELLAKVRSVVHCKDCEWWTKQEASIQGRCARLAIYPTGEFYCGSGSRAEPPKGVE